MAALTTQELSVTGSGLSETVVGGVLGAIVAVVLVLVAVIVVVILVVMRKRTSWKPEEEAPEHSYNNAVYGAGTTDSCKGAQPCDTACRSPCILQNMSS